MSCIYNDNTRICTGAQKGSPLRVQSANMQRQTCMRACILTMRAVWERDNPSACVEGAETNPITLHNMLAHSVRCVRTYNIRLHTQANAELVLELRGKLTIQAYMKRESRCASVLW